MKYYDKEKLINLNETFTEEEMVYLNEPFTQEDLEYIKGMSNLINN